MLSILIPIYNFDCRQLVKDLVVQAQLLTAPIEIVCLDDASSENFRVLNQEVETYDAIVTYDYLPRNVGRSKIRNLLVRRARYSHVLFMDCDAGVPNAGFLANYLPCLQPNLVVCGGRSYQLESPKDKALLLHWTVGNAREQISAQRRSQNPYHSFMTNNFVAPTTLFRQLSFNEKLTQYGHEDTLFGLALKKQKLAIAHIDNPLYHIGLEDTNAFLRKTEQALENLVYLIQNDYPVETRLLQLFWQLKQLRLLTVFLHSFRTVRPHLLRQLCGDTPSLFVFDAYKLGIFIEKYVASQ
jgi:hypothetical protein